MQPPGDIEWHETLVGIARNEQPAFIAVFAETPPAQSFVDMHWNPAYGQGSALFVRHITPIVGAPVGFTPSGSSIYDPAPQPPEVWFVPKVSISELWPFVRNMGFRNAEVAREVIQACDVFLAGLALRQPFGIEEVWDGMGMVSFRRYRDGGDFDIADMRRACELNVAVLGGPQDESHLDDDMPRHFKKQGFFCLGA